MNLEEKLVELREKWKTDPSRRKLIEAQARCIQRAIEKRDAIDTTSNKVYTPNNVRGEVSKTNEEVPGCDRPLQSGENGKRDSANGGSNYNLMLSLLKSGGTKDLFS
jgi:hypothetical protein